MTAQKNIAIFASGAGSNARVIIEQAKAQMLQYKVALIVCNKPGAGVLAIAHEYNIPTLIIDRKPFAEGDAYVPALRQHNIDFVVLAGFLWKVPLALVQAYSQRIINIHPALLPKYGGKGMYGMHVHEAVVASKETQTGITIHWVNEIYDNGKIIFQATCAVTDTDTATDVAAKVHKLEHYYFYQIINTLLT